MDSYEEKQKRLLALFEEMDSGSEKDELSSDYDDSIVDPEYINSGQSDDDSEDSEDIENSEYEGQNGSDHIEDSVDEVEELWISTTADIPNFNFDECSAGCQIIGNSPREVFDSFCGDELLKILVDSTNTYGNRLCSDQRSTRYSRAAKFKPINLTEMLKFIGLCLLQGQIKPPKMRHLFSKHPLYYHPVFPSTMSGRRFEQILRCFNVNSQIGEKHLSKISSFVKLFTDRCQASNRPSKHLSLDESLLLFRGRLHFRMYIKNKKSRYGIKFFELCDPNGYVFNLEIYGGKQNTDPTCSKINSLVLRLMEPYLGKGHTVFMDNYYNSVSLCNVLLSHKTHTCGTLRSNRKENPKELIAKKLKKNEHIWLRKGNIYVSKWKDKRDVLCINTAYHPAMALATNSYGKERNKPIEVEEYNQNMSGVDRLDQLVSYYSCPRKTVRWYKKVIFHIIDIAVFNSYFIYKKKFPKITFLKFRESLICSFLNVQDIPNGRNLKIPPNRAANIPIFPEASAASTSSSSQHFLEKSPLPNGWKRKSYFRDCRCCTLSKKRKQTAFQCKQCPGNPPLCLNCCESWHNSAIHNPTLEA